MTRSILVVAACPFPAGRGSQLLIERMSRGLVELGHRVVVLCPRNAEAGRVTDLELIRVPLTAADGAIESRIRLRRAIDDALLAARSMRHSCDLVMGHNVEGGLIAGLTARVLGRPAVYVRHSDFGEELGTVAGWPRLLAPLGARADRLASRMATRVISLVPIPETRPGWDIIPPPLDPDEATIEPADGRTLYYEGNLDPYQNPDWLGRTLSRARESWPDSKLVVASGPTERPTAADLALLPRTLSGGFPMKLLTYQVAGIPALTTARGAPGQCDGLDAAVLGDPPEPERFADRACELLRDPALLARLRKTARIRAFERSAPDRVAKEIDATIERALADRSGGR